MTVFNDSQTLTMLILGCCTFLPLCSVGIYLFIYKDNYAAFILLSSLGGFLYFASLLFHTFHTAYCATQEGEP